MPHILLVEDDTNLSLMLTRQLQRAGYSVRHANSMAAARELVREGTWELALLDRGLPDGDGLDLCRELRASSPHGYILMFTGMSSDENRLEGFEYGADDYVSKDVRLDEVLARIRAGVRIVGLQSRLIETNKRLEELSLTDALTNIGNRRAFDNRFALLFEHARRYERPLSLVLVDVDRFKSINDQRGHSSGDEVLRSVAKRIAAGTRQTDFAARIGGEEFGILLPETPLFEAMQFCEKIRASIAAEPMDGFRVTVSLGVANVPHSLVPTQQELYTAADAALYRAKANGRNRVEMERRRECRKEYASPMQLTVR
ncbi:MAG TPA: diguanylate cyclase [Thermoanaerobaculia bacterium]|nr:diguanylate cyclase [Thermoanaerobaculia bacterium]